MARYRMYQVVYFHKTTRAAEVMLRLVFKRYQELLREAEGADPLPEAPQALRRVFTAGGKAELADYLDLDDHTITEFLKAARRHADPQLNRLAAGLLDRSLYKATDVSGIDLYDEQVFRREAEAAVRKQGLDVEYCFVSDRPADTPYKPYDPSSGKAPSMVYVEGPDGRPEEISRLSSIVQQLMGKRLLVRHYYPVEVRDEVRGIADRTFGRGR